MFEKTKGVLSNFLSCVGELGEVWSLGKSKQALINLKNPDFPNIFNNFLNSPGLEFYFKILYLPENPWGHKGIARVKFQIQIDPIPELHKKEHLTPNHSFRTIQR